MSLANNAIHEIDEKHLDKPQDEVSAKISKLYKNINQNTIPNDIKGIEYQRIFNEGVVQIIQDSDGIIFGGYLLTKMMECLYENVEILPHDIDVLVKNSSLQFFLRALKRHCDVTDITCFTDKSKADDYASMANNIVVNTYLIETKESPFKEPRRSIKMDCVLYDGTPDFRKILRKPDFNINTLYMSHGALGAVWAQSTNFCYTEKVINRIQQSIKQMKAYYMGTCHETLDSEFEAYKRRRINIFKRSMKMLAKGFEVVGSPYLVIMRDDDCVICTKQRKTFISTKCCRGISCLKCFEKHVLLELETRITFRCMFHRDDQQTGMSVIPKVHIDEY
jgi:hypothetical protein